MPVFRQSEINGFSSAIVNITLVSGLAYGVCALTGLANPVAGAVLFGTARATDYITKPMFKSIFNQNRGATRSSQFLGLIFRTAANFSVGYRIVSKFGLALPAISGTMTGALAKLALAVNAVSLPVLASVIIFVSLMSYSFVALSASINNRNQRNANNPTPPVPQ